MSLRVQCVRRRRGRTTSGRTTSGDWLPAACRSLFPLVHQEGIASSASTRPQVVSSVSSLAKEITTRARKVACACKIESRTCSLSYATKVRTRINNDDDDYNEKNLAKKLRKVVSPSFSASDNENKNENEKA